MDKLVIDCMTGERGLVSMNAEEIAALEAERAAYVEPSPPTEQVFDIPLVAPDFIVASPKPKGTPAEALAHAQALSVAERKPLADIVLNLMVVITDMDRQIKELKSK